MKGKLLGCMVLAAWICFATAHSGIAQVQIDNRDTYDLNGHIQILREQDKRISVAQAREKYLQAQFKPIQTPNSNLNFGFTYSVYWIAIPVENQGGQKVELESGIAKTGIFKIDFYLIDQASGRVGYNHKSGAVYDFKSRAIANRHFYFPITLDPGQKAIIFYRIDQRGSAFHAPFRLIKSEYRRSSELKVYLVYAFFCGLIAFVSFFSLVSFFWYKERIYLFYSLYALFCGVFFLSDSGLGSQWLYPTWVAWDSIATSMYAGGIVIFRLSFTNDFLHLKSVRPKLHRIILFWMGLIVILMVLIPLVFIANKDVSIRPAAYFYGAVVFMGEWAIQIYCIAIMIKNKYKPAYLYGLSIFSVFAVTIIYNLSALNIIHINQLPYYYLLMGFTVEIFILSFALVYKFNFHKQKHHQLQLNFNEEIMKTQLEIQEQTFRDISQEIHDNIGQVLSLTKLTINTIDLSNPVQTEEKVNESSGLLTQAIKDLRELSHTLNTGFISEIGLVKAVEQQLLVFQKTKLYQTQLIVTGEEWAYDPQKQLVLFRIIQELLHNVVKHAAASQINVEIDFKPRLLHIQISDNGKGFDPALLPTKGGCGIGLSNIQNRMDLIKGSCNIKSKPGQGTSVAISLPTES